MAVEYDGDQHRERRQHARDLRRHNALRALGRLVLQVDAEQLACPEAVVAAVRALLNQRRLPR